MTRTPFRVGPRRSAPLALASVTALALSSCTLLGEGDAEPTAAEPTTSATAAASDDAATSASTAAPVPEPVDTGTVVLAAHDSFTLPDDLVAAFEEQSGYELEIQLSGDAGQMANQVVLTAGNPTADVVFGVDNTFASRVIDAEALQAYTSDALPESAEEHALPLSLIHI